MAFFAKLNTDASLGSPPKLTRLAKGWRGVKSFRVECVDPELAWDALGLPNIGESWSDLRKDLKVVEVDLTRHSGRLLDPGGDLPGGLTIFEVRFETAGLSGKIPYVDGLKYTVLQPSVTELTVYHEPPGNGGPFEGVLIGNGRGAQKKIPVLGAKVYAYFAPEKWNGLAAVLQKAGFVNKDQVVLPPCLGQDIGYVMEPGQLLFLTAGAQSVAGLLEVCFEVELARDFLYRYQNENADGDAVGPVYNSVIYEATDLAGLW